jgi:hypothetical protein
MKLIHFRRIGLPAVLTVLMVSASVFFSGLLFADQPVSFPGSEVGARAAANQGLANAVKAQARSNGLVLQIVGFVADDAQTMVSYVLTGREVEGNTAFGAEPPVMIDAAGNTYQCTRASADPSDHRKGTWVFPPIQSIPGTLTVLVNGFQLGNVQDSQTVAVTDVPGTWKVSFTWDGKKAPNAVRVRPSPSVAAFGKGQIRIDGIEQAATGTIVRGTLVGFSPDVIPYMECPVAGMETTNGPVDFVACRLGVGEDRSLFEITYPLIAGKVDMIFQVQYEEDSASFVGPDQVIDQGSTAVFEADLPAR